MKTELQLPSALPEGWTRTDPKGLSEAEAAGRKKNILPRDDGKPTVRIITENVFTLFNMLNLLLALALICTYAENANVISPKMYVRTAFRVCPPFHNNRSKH